MYLQDYLPIKIKKLKNDLKGLQLVFLKTKLLYTDLLEYHRALKKKEIKKKRNCRSMFSDNEISN